MLMALRAALQHRRFNMRAKTQTIVCFDKPQTRIALCALDRHRDAAVTSLIPALSITIKQASNSSTDRGGGKRRSHPCAGSAEEETSWAVPKFLGITQRVPVTVVVGLTGEHFGFVMFAFFSVRFGSGNDRRDILRW